MHTIYSNKLCIYKPLTIATLTFPQIATTIVSYAAALHKSKIYYVNTNLICVCLMITVFAPQKPTVLKRLQVKQNVLTIQNSTVFGRQVQVTDHWSHTVLQ